jgi:hypothetical protein
VPNILVCRADADPVLVERVTATLFGARDALARTVPQGERPRPTGGDRHLPGAAACGSQRHYRLVKI